MRILPLVLLGLALSVQATPRTEILPLNYRTAEELLPAVQSILGDQGRASAYGGQLIVNAEPAKLDELKGLLTQLDTRPRRLLISLATRAGSRDSATGYTLEGTPQGPAGRVIDYGTDDRNDQTQRVQASEGYPAVIHLGEEVPVTTLQSTPYGQLYPQTDYRETQRGFQVTARLTGNVAHLTVDSLDERPDRQHPGAISRGGASTRLSGPVGQWLELGGIEQGGATEDRGLARYYSTQGHDDRQLSIRVDVLD